MKENQGYNDIVVAQVTGTAAPSTAADVATTSTTTTPPVGATELMFWEIGFYGVVMVVLFYFLMIRPQKQRYKEYSTMLGQLKKGDKVVLQSGMIGVIDAIDKDGQEATIEFIGGIKSHVFKSAIAGTYESYTKK
jgi:preprotein translocase YajC subunit